VRDIFITQSPTPSGDHVVFKDDSGQYYVPTGVTEEEIKIKSTDYIIFRSQKIPLKIEGEIKFAGDRKWYVHPQIKYYVKYKLESIFNKISIKNDTITRLNQIENNRRIS
jgi:hypothetical protein